MKRITKYKTIIIAVVSIVIANNANAEINQQKQDIKKYFKSIEGTWEGNGEVIAGKYKDTKFKCTLNGKTPKKIGMDIEGNCKIGIFNQKITAKITRHHDHYRGTFLGGAEKYGLDVVSGKLSNDIFIAALVRENINGSIIVNATHKNKMGIYIAVEVNERFYPIIELELDKQKKRKKRIWWLP